MYVIKQMRFKTAVIAWADLGNLHQGGQCRVRGRARGQVNTSAVGASRGKQGAEGAEGVGLGERVSPPQWGGVWGGGRAPPQKIFDFKLAYFYGF